MERLDKFDARLLERQMKATQGAVQRDTMVLAYMVGSGPARSLKDMAADFMRDTPAFEIDQILGR